MNTHAALVTEERVRFDAVDGFPLSGTLYFSGHRGAAPSVAVFNAGGGVPAARYKRIARYFAAGGVPTLTYDYRGIGESAPASLREFSAVLEDWSEYDCGGAIAWLRGQFPSSAVVGIGHSVGTLIFGGARQAQELTRFVMICPHIGYFGDYRLGYRLPMAVLWHGVMPAITKMVGYFPAQALRLGEDIPRGIAMQWAARVTPRLRPDGGSMTKSRGALAIQRCHELASPALLVTANDDAFATIKGARRFLTYFPKLSAIHWVVDARKMRVPRLGHFGLFRASAEANIWPAILAYILHGTPPRASTPIKPVKVQASPRERNEAAHTMEDGKRA